MEIAIVPATLAVASPTNRAFSSLRHLSGSDQLRFPTLSFDSPLREPRSLTIRMGGGPRTFPGGVSKWQWKRMQAKKAKQLLKARLCRERQLYEMRKRAELKAAVAELEKPWEVVERAPTLFSVKADEQVKALADRFQKPGGFDMWTEKDGPQVFRAPDGLPSARFFPKGVVHSVRPYGIVDGEGEMRFDDWIARGGDGGSGYRRSWRRSSDRHGRERSEVLEGGSGEGIVHTRCLMNVQKDGGGEIRDVNYGHEDGGKVGIDGWSGSKRSMRISPSRRHGPETEYVVAEFEDSVEQGEEVSRNLEDGGGNVDSSFRSRNWGLSRMEEGYAMEGGHGSGMDEFESSRFSRKSGGLKKSYGERGGASSSRYSTDSKIEKGNAMGGGRRYGGHAPYGRERGLDRRSYASDPETMEVHRAERGGASSSRYSTHSKIEKGNAMGGGQRYGRQHAPYGRERGLDQRSYASDPETMEVHRAERGGASSSRYSTHSKVEKGNAMGGGRRYGRRAPYGREHGLDRRSYASDPETMEVHRADGSEMDGYESSRFSRKAGGLKKSYDERDGASSSRYSTDSKIEKGYAMGGGQRYGRHAPYGRGRGLDRRSYASDPETMEVDRADGSRMDGPRNARGSSYGRGRRTNQRSYASDSETMGSQQGRHVGGPPYRRRTYASYSETITNGRGRDDGRNPWGIRSKKLATRPSIDPLYDSDV